VWSKNNHASHSSSSKMLFVWCEMKTAQKDATSRSTAKGPQVKQLVIYIIGTCPELCIKCADARPDPSCWEYRISWRPLQLLRLWNSLSFQSQWLPTSADSAANSQIWRGWRMGWTMRDTSCLTFAGRPGGFTGARSGVMAAHTRSKIKHFEAKTFRNLPGVRSSWVQGPKHASFCIQGATSHTNHFIKLKPICFRLKAEVASYHSMPRFS